MSGKKQTGKTHVKPNVYNYGRAPKDNTVNLPGVYFIQNKEFLRSLDKLLYSIYSHVYGIVFPLKLSICFPFQPTCLLIPLDQELILVTSQREIDLFEVHPAFRYFRIGQIHAVVLKISVQII